jgi:hypothetical protein
MALEKSETVETVVEVINPLLTKTTVVRRKVRSEYTARYEEFCKGGDKVKASSSEFWGGLGSLGGKAGAETRQGKKGEASSSVAGSVFRQLNVAAPKDVPAVAGHHAKEEKSSIGTDTFGGDSASLGDPTALPSRSPARRRSSTVGLFQDQRGSGRHRSAHPDEGKTHGRDGGGRATEPSREDNQYVASFRRFISEQRAACHLPGCLCPSRCACV